MSWTRETRPPVHRLTPETQARLAPDAMAWANERGDTLELRRQTRDELHALRNASIPLQPNRRLGKWERRRQLLCVALEAPGGAWAAARELYRIIKG